MHLPVRCTRQVSFSTPLASFLHRSSSARQLHLHSFHLHGLFPACARITTWIGHLLHAARGSTTRLCMHRARPSTRRTPRATLAAMHWSCGAAAAAAALDVSRDGCCSI